MSSPPLRDKAFKACFELDEKYDLAGSAADWPWATSISNANDDAQLLTLSGLNYITSMKLTMKYELMSVLYH